MKIRSGFVSNSSSSSFCVVGINNEDLVGDICEAIQAKSTKKYPRDSIYEKFCYFEDSSEGNVLGINLVSMLKKEFLDKLKAQVREEIEKESGIKVPVEEIIVLSGEYAC
jgi:hypothetical protein